MVFLLDTIFQNRSDELDGLYPDFLLPFKVVLGVTVAIGQKLIEALMKKQKLTFINQSILLNVNHNPITCIDLVQAPLGQPHYVGHKRLLGWLQEVRRQVWNVHVAPLQRENHAHEGFND